jgi:hypothetical protein
VKTFSAQELEDRLLDYLYDELEADEKAAFEAALPAHPDLVAEVEAHRGTRVAMAALPHTLAAPALPDGGLAALMAEAENHARNVAQPSSAAEVRPAAAATPVSLVQKQSEPQSSSGDSLFARIGKALHAALMTPAFATAAVALLVTGVAVVMARRGDLPGADRSAEGQQISAVAPVEVAPSSPSTATIAATPAPAAEPAAAEVARLDLPTPAKSADENEDLKQEAFPATPKAPASPVAAAKVEKVAEAKKMVGPTSGDAAPKASGGEGFAAAADDGVAYDSVVDAATTWKDGAGRTGVYGGSADKDAAKAPPSQPRGYSAPSNVDENYAEHPAEPARPAAAPKTEVAEKPMEREEEAAPTDTRKALDDYAGGGVPREQQKGLPAPSAPARQQEGVAENERAAKTDSTNRQDTVQTQVTNLWARYDRQLASGDIVGAEKTLKELVTLGADTTRVRSARARLSAVRAKAAPAEVKPATQSK